MNTCACVDVNRAGWRDGYKGRNSKDMQKQIDANNKRDFAILVTRSDLANLNLVNKHWLEIAISTFVFTVRTLASTSASPSACSRISFISPHDEPSHV